MITTVTEAKAVIWSLSQPSKMPCHGYSTPAAACPLGSKLAKIAGTICAFCYALKGRYLFRNVVRALAKRLESLRDPQWVEAMAFLLNRPAYSRSGYFRWHDSGDIQGPWHLDKIAAVCRLTPHLTHWLPTREYSVVKAWLATNDCPPNLTIRLSAARVDAKPPVRYGLPTSSVVSNPDQATCPAPGQGGNCGNCRACWDPNVADVAYEVH